MDGNMTIDSESNSDNGSRDHAQYDMKDMKPGL